MSFTLEYNRVVYKDEQGNMFLFTKMGDSNVYDSQSNLRSRDWYFLAFGPDKELWKTIGRRAGMTVGGTLQRAVGWNGSQWWKIEDYIKLYRSKISNARSVSKLLKDFDLVFVMEISSTITDKEKTRCETIIRNDSFKYRGTHYYNKDTSIYEKSIEHLDELYNVLEKFPMNLNERGLYTHFLVNPLKKRI